MQYGYHYISQYSDGQNGDDASFKLIKHTNLEMMNSACLHAVHILQQPTSSQTTKSTQGATVNAQNMKRLPLPVGKYGNSTRRFTQQHHQENKVKCSLHTGSV